MTILEDGSGNGYKVRIGPSLRMATESVTETLEELSINQGNGFNIATPRITLTTTNESALFYIKNNDDRELILTTVFVNSSNSTGTLSNQPYFKVYRNPKTGTLIDNARLIEPINKNYGSKEIITADIYYGAEGDTIGGEDGIIDIPMPPRDVLPLAEFVVTVILPKGSSYAHTYRPSTGNTSVDIITGCNIYKLPERFA